MANLNGAKRVKVSKSSLDVGAAHQDNCEQFHKITGEAANQDVLMSGKTLFNLFPEIWDEMLAYLSASDFHSLINSSSFINQLLEEKKTTLLLSLVLSILMEYIPFSSLLQLRGVNRAAKSLITEALESHSSSLDGYWTSTYKGSGGGRHPLHANESRIQFTSLRLSQNAYFNPPQLLSRFLNRHKLERSGDSSTPFLTRSITLPVTVHDDTPFQEQKTLRLELMTKFGHQLRHLRCHVGTCFIEPNELNHAALTGEFISLLHHIPNLRILTLLGGNRFQPGAVAGLRRISPIPDLPHLELLDFENFTFNSGLPHEDDHDVDPEEALDIWLLSKYGSQLKGLICQRRFLEATSVSASWLNTTAPHVSRLRVVEAGTDAVLQKLTQLRWPLEQLELSARSFQSIPLGSLVRVINRFSETLVSLRLIFDGVYVCEQGRGLTPNLLEELSKEKLPKLRKFGTNVENINLEWFWSLFGAKLENLEELTLYAQKMNYAKDPELVEETLQKAEKGFEVFPKLKQIVLVISPLPVAAMCRKVIMKRGGRRVIQKEKNWKEVFEMETRTNDNYDET